MLILTCAFSCSRITDRHRYYSRLNHNPFFSMEAWWSRILAICVEERGKKCEKDISQRVIIIQNLIDSIIHSQRAIQKIHQDMFWAPFLPRPVHTCIIVVVTARYSYKCPMIKSYQTKSGISRPTPLIGQPFPRADM